MAECTTYYNCKPPSFLERIRQTSAPQHVAQDLDKCLSLFDLTVQGLAHIVGVAIFIMTPGVIQSVSGPGLVVSYILAAAALSFTVLAYMDLGARYRGIGNCYVYVYSTLGELAAGVVGVFIMTDLALQLAFSAVGFGQNMDRFLFSGSVHRLEVRIASTLLPHSVAGNFNLMGIALIVVCCVINCAGVKKVSLTNILTVLFTLVTLAMYCVLSVVYGSYTVFSNSTDPDTGRGGMFPYGIEGVVHGAAIVVISFNGFETVVSLSAEATNQRRDVPRAVGVSFALSVVIYVLVSAAISYLVPWYTLTASTGIVGSLAAHHLVIPQYITTVAVLLSSFSVVLCFLTTLARGILVLAEDGLLFPCLSVVAECSRVPVLATITATVIVILFTLVFSFHMLTSLVSGGTLLAFTAVCFTQIVISYTKTETVVNETTQLIGNEIVAGEKQDGNHGNEMVADEGQPGNRTNKKYRAEEQAGNSTTRTDTSYVEHQERSVTCLMAVFSVTTIVAITLYRCLTSASLWVRVPLLLAPAGIDVTILCYIKHKYNVQDPGYHGNQQEPGFVCPGVPFTPGIGIVCNLVLFGTLATQAYLFTAAYFAVGLVIYFGYGYFHSRISLQKQREL